MSAVGEVLPSFLNANTDLLWTAIVAAIVSAGVSYFFKQRETRYTLEAEYEYEQRKKLRNLIAEFHGRMLSAANSLNYRMWNIYSNHSQEWLHVLKNYSRDNHYFHSSVHRFLVVSSLARQFERKAIYVDARIARRNDFLFLRYVATFHWCMTDTALFDGLVYDKEHEVDHFFSDNFRRYCDLCVKEDGSIVEFEELIDEVQGGRELDPVLSFFDGLSPDEERYRWDRLVVLHLLLMGFINTFGYEEQETSIEKIQKVASQIRHPEILENIISWLPRHGLIDKKGGKRILKVCKAILPPNKMRNLGQDSVSSL